MPGPLTLLRRAVDRILLTEWAYVRLPSGGLPSPGLLRTWLHWYNHHRAHTALGGGSPTSRVTNLPGHYS